MSEMSMNCDRFAEWLLDGDGQAGSSDWTEHLESCVDCEGQWESHQLLTATLGAEDEPELSLAFQAGLERKLASAVEVRPLNAWGKAAMIVYGVAATGMAGWALRNVPLPTIDLSAQWVPFAALLAVPLTFVLATAVSRWLPAPQPPQGLRAFSL